MSSQRPANALLRSLENPDWEALKSHLEPFPLDHGDTIYEMGDAADWVVFPETGLLSIITILASGAAIETSIVGREGSIGFVEALGGGRLHSRVIVQIPGRGYRIYATRFRRLHEHSPQLQRAVHQQVELLLAESRQAIACHTAHSLKARFCRWLLECDDLSGGVRPLPLTQEFLSFMLGVQRTSVTAIALEAQESGLINYSRGRLDILDAHGLEHRACECRASLQALRAELAPNLFGRPPVALKG